MNESSTAPGGSSPPAGELDMKRRSQISLSIGNTQAALSRQQEQLRHVNEENDQLKKEIAAVSGNNYDYVKADKLAALQGDVDALERRYQFEKMKKNDLTKRYQLARIDLMHSRKQKGGVYAEQEQSDAVQRQMDILENRLDQALSKFNDALSFNKELRDQIDILREERRVFQRVHKKMDDDLRARKRLMADRIEQSNRDMEERDECQRQAAQLHAQIAKQQGENADRLQSLDKAMLELRTMREDQTNLQFELEAREFEFERQLADLQAEANDPTAGTANSTASGTTLAALAPGGNNITVTGAGGSSRRAIGNAAAAFGGGEMSPLGGPGGDSFGGGDGTADGFTAVLHLLRIEDEPTTIADIVAQVSEATQTADLAEVRAEYSRLADSNFSLYKYINELTASREALLDELRDLRLLLSEESESEGEQRRLIKGLEDKLAVTEGRLEWMQANNGQLCAAVALAGTATEDVYAHIGCNTGETTTTTTASSGGAANESRCTEANLLLFLGDIDERSTHIICAYQRYQLRGDAAASPLGGNGNSSPRSAIQLRATEAGRSTGGGSVGEGTLWQSVEMSMSGGAVDGSGGGGMASSAAMEAEDDANSGRNLLPPQLCADEIGVMEVAPLFSTAPQTAPNAVSAKRLVRVADLPSASLANHSGGNSNANSDAGGGDEDRIMSHEEIRRQMEQRLMSRREREERLRQQQQLQLQQQASRRRKDGGGGGVSPRKIR